MKKVNSDSEIRFIHAFVSTGEGEPAQHYRGFDTYEEAVADKETQKKFYTNIESHIWQEIKTTIVLS